MLTHTSHIYRKDRRYKTADNGPGHWRRAMRLLPSSLTSPETTPLSTASTFQSYNNVAFDTSGNNKSSTSSSSSICGSGTRSPTGRYASARDQTDSSRFLHRRQFLAAAAGVIPTLGQAAATAGAAISAETAPPPTPSLSSFLQPLLPSPAPDLLAQLEGRAPIFQPGVAWSRRNRDRQLFYPAWLAGEWEVTARFAAASFPQGHRLLGRTVPGVLKGSMVAALPDVGAAMDGVFNVRQLMDAFYSFAVTRKVEYEPLKNPTRLTVVYATPRKDKSVISEDLRKAELIINNRISQEISPTDFIVAELFRQMAVATTEVTAATAAAASGSVVVTGIGAEVQVLQRVAAFLQPQDAAFFEAGNQAVAVYDYTYTLKRVA
ncbi:hypothetical protein VOLCADRAFT_127341 [Volvox carteri f. nagariensis]|uniref:DUF6816 domain-containing protein n=1 Tax=Volvox carteri f. nagariensis TaxID=3068 RepID=D8THM9_VOLCA|nr:uncharacterized protein VOLCADRAFT_127341 [Volvox carteri f. nagariensis]EFJ52741.1 hypothetical protein VOLCADRAFT_127341 [Volvox carteri f. nagariensis]|eukprot:XP_002945746.1 hypothetical protein VOLCADRAFT_127341 [Volvox carteri f. nagariensis]